MSSLISTIHDVVLVHSKSKALMKASRKRLSLNFRRRVLKNQRCARGSVQVQHANQHRTSS